jgi:hypothetical protein
MMRQLGGSHYDAGIMFLLLQESNNLPASLITELAVSLLLWYY